MRPFAFAILFSLSAALACEPVKVDGLSEPGAQAVEVAIMTTPPGATVVVDGTPLGPAPHTVKLNPGPHVIKATKSGYFPAEERVRLSASDGARTVTLTLVASH